MDKGILSSVPERLGLELKKWIDIQKWLKENILVEYYWVVYWVERSSGFGSDDVA